MKSTKTETAIYSELRLNVSMNGEEEDHKNHLAFVHGALPRRVQNAESELQSQKPDGFQEQRFLDLALEFSKG